MAGGWLEPTLGACLPQNGRQGRRYAAWRRLYPRIPRDCPILNKLIIFSLQASLSSDCGSGNSHLLIGAAKREPTESEISDPPRDFRRFDLENAFQLLKQPILGELNISPKVLASFASGPSVPAQLNIVGGKFIFLAPTRTAALSRHLENPASDRVI